MKKSSDREPFRSFRYTYPVTDAIITETVARRQKRYVPTGFAGRTAEQQLAVYLTTPSRVIAPDIIVRPAAWSDDNGRPEGALSDAYLAEATGRRVIAPNAPGVDHAGFREVATEGRSHQLTPSQLDMLRTGRFSFVGKAMLRAVEGGARHWQIDEPSYTIVASSMGAAVAAGMLDAAGEQGIPIHGVALAETVNGITRSVPTLGRQFTQQKHPDAYLRQNPERLYTAGESTGFWLRRVWESRQANFAYVRAMALGQVANDLGSLDHLEGVPVYLTRGSESRLSPRVVNDILEEKFGRVTDVKRDEFTGADHPYTMTIQSIVDEVALLDSMHA